MAKYPLGLFLVISILLIQNNLVLAQEECANFVRGVVIDDHDRTFLEFANLLIVETGQGAATNAQGEFVIKEVCNGKYTIRYSHIGCETMEQQIVVNGNIDLELKLEHHVELLETITLEATSFDRSVSQSDAEIGSEEIAKMSGQSLGQALESLNGVQSLQTGPATFKPMIRGLHSNRVILFNQGLRQSGQEWGSDHAPEIDPGSANELLVIKGAGTMAYGVDAIGGVVVAQRGRLNYNEDFRGSVQLTGMTNGRLGGVNVELESSFGRNQQFAYAFQGSVKKSGDFRASDYFLTNTGLREHNASLSIGHERNADGITLYLSTFNSEIGVLRSAHIGNLTDFERALTAEEPLIVEPFSYDILAPKQKVRHHLAKIEGRKWFRWGTVKAIYGIQLNDRQEFDIRRGDRNEIPALDLGLVSQQARVSFHHHNENDDVHGTLGLTWNYQDNTNRPETGIRPLVPDYLAVTPGIYLTERIEKSSWQGEIGLRYDYRYMKAFRFNAQNVLERPEFRFHQFAATAGGSFELANNWQLSLNLSTAHRAPDIHELFSEGLHHGAAAIEEGDVTLTPERSFEVQFGVDGQSGKFIEYDLSIYAKRINDFIYLEPQRDPRLTIRGAFPVFQYVQNDANLIGMDATLKLNANEHFQLVSELSLIRGTEIESDVPLVFMPPSRFKQRLIYQSDQNRDVSWYAQATFDFVARQTRFSQEVDLVEPPDAYSLLHSEIGVQFPLGSQEARCSIQVTNALNTSYRSYLNRLRYYADEIGRNISLRMQLFFNQKTN